MEGAQRDGLSLAGLRHSFGEHTVLHDVALTVAPGEVLALAGENGAGKSTLMRIVGGYLTAGAGVVTWRGGPLPVGIRAVEAAGITLVHQEFALIGDLSVAENISLGHEPRRGLLIDRRAMAARAREALALLGAEIAPWRQLSQLPVASWQMVELAKAFSGRPRLLLMDEPTAVLGARETEALFARIRAFVAEGGAVVFTSHRLDEVRQIADRVAVLRDGAITLDAPVAGLSENDIASAMVGRTMTDLFPPRVPPQPAPPVLRVAGLSVPRALGEDVTDAAFELHPGEILGVAGLVGAGRTEMFEGLVGLRPARAARFELRGVARPLPRGREAARAGIAYLSEDRKARGLLLDANLVLNVNLTRGALTGPAFIDRADERRVYDAAEKRYDIRAASPRLTVGRLSGGNQQKVLFAKTLVTEPDIVILDEPTRGVDIGAKSQIYRVIADLAAAGKAVVVISSEMPEILGLAHRVLVMDRGRVAGCLSQPETGSLSETQILRLALGLHTDESAA